MQISFLFFFPNIPEASVIFYLSREFVSGCVLTAEGGTAVENSLFIFVFYPRHFIEYAVRQFFYYLFCPPKKSGKKTNFVRRILCVPRKEPLWRWCRVFYIKIRSEREGTRYNIFLHTVEKRGGSHAVQHTIMMYSSVYASCFYVNINFFMENKKYARRIQRRERFEAKFAQRRGITGGMEVIRIV